MPEHEQHPNAAEFLRAFKTLKRDSPEGPQPHTADVLRAALDANNRLFTQARIQKIIRDFRLQASQLDLRSAEADELLARRIVEDMTPGAGR